MHGITIHGPNWHYLFEVRHFHYMMDEHISKYNSFVAFHILVCSSSHTRAYPLLREHQIFHADFHSPFDLVVDPCELHIGAYPPSLGSSNLSQALLSFDLVVNPYELSYLGISPLVEFSCIIILVILWLWATWSFIHLVSMSLSYWARTYINQSSSC